MSENNSEVEYLGTTLRNTQPPDPSLTATQQILSQPTIISCALSLARSEFPDLDIPSVRENLTQSQPRLCIH